MARTVIYSLRMVRKRNYCQEKDELEAATFETDVHPLMTATGTKTNYTPAKKRLSSNYSDPLLGFALEGSDPLSQRSEECSDDDQRQSISRVFDQPADKISHQWLQQRTAIFNRFTTTEKLSITSSFLQGGEKCNNVLLSSARVLFPSVTLPLSLVLLVVVKQQIRDKTRHRLQQLEQLQTDEYEESVSEHRGLSQDDYIKIITQISEELQQAWKMDQRVKSLKIVIQVTTYIVSYIFFMKRKLDNNVLPPPPVLEIAAGNSTVCILPE